MKKCILQRRMTNIYDNIIWRSNGSVYETIEEWLILVTENSKENWYSDIVWNDIVDEDWEYKLILVCDLMER